MGGGKGKPKQMQLHLPTGDEPRDPFSSAWREQGTDPPVAPARTWLLSVGWRIRAGAVLLLLVDE